MVTKRVLNYLIFGMMWGESYVSYVARTSYIWWDDDICFVLDQHAQLDLYSASSLKQQSANRHVAPLKTHYPDLKPTNVFLFLLNATWFSGEATNTNLIVFCLTWQGLEYKIYSTQFEHVNHYTTEVVFDMCGMVNVLLFGVWNGTSV